MNSCYHPTKLTLPKFRSNIFTEPPKYVKLHVMAENSENRPEITEPCSRCSLPTGSKASDQESENVKSCGMHMPTYHPIFVIIRWIKTQLFAQGTWTCVIPLRSHINLIVGPTGPNKFCNAEEKFDPSLTFIQSLLFFPPTNRQNNGRKSKPYSIFLATQESFFGEINISSLKYNSTWNLKKRHIYYVSEKPGKQISHLFLHPHGLSIREDRYLSCGGWYWGFRITTDSAYLFCCFCYSHGKMNSVDIVFL